MRWICFFLVSAWLGLGAAAAEPARRAEASYIITSWGTEDGLPRNTVTAVTQTRDGYLWLGTLNGLVRFDGDRFTVFDEVNTPGLDSSGITCLFEDRQGGLWLGTETAGIALLKDGLVASLGLGRSTHEGRLVAACQDAAGGVWLHTADGQLWRHQAGRADPFLAGPVERAGEWSTPSFTRALIAERDGPLWLGSDRRQSAFGPAQEAGALELSEEASLPVTNKLDFLLASARGGYWRLADGRVQRCRGRQIEQDLGAYPWGRERVMAACEDLDGRLLVGLLGAGVYWFDGQGRALCVSTNQGLSHNNVLSLCVDREGSVWVGTDGGGLNRVRRPLFEVLDVSRGPESRAVQSVCADPQGGLWIGANNGGAVRWRDGELERYGPAQGLVNQYVWSVLIDRERRVWAGSWGAPGLFQRPEDRDTFQLAQGPDALRRSVHALYQDRLGQVWAGTQGGVCRRNAEGWRAYTTADGLSADEVQAIAEDRQGGLWFGTAGGGLNRLANDRFTVFHKSDGLPSEDISALFVDADDVLWIGTTGSGLARLSQGRFTRYTKREGLVSNSINYIIEDDQGWLWIGSNSGLMRLSKHSLNERARTGAPFVVCRAYSRLDGLPTQECTQGSQPGAARDAAGRLWFSTIRGLVSVDSSQLRTNPHAPPVVIESVLIDGEPQNTNALLAGRWGTVTVPVGKEHLEIRYTSLNLSAPDRARFRYRLEGYESAWIEAGSLRVANYSRLPPGEYRFVTTACNEDGVWNAAGSALDVVVPPPWWRTWWFIITASIAALGTVVSVVHVLSTQRLNRQLETMRQREALEKERQRIARDIHDQLGASLTQVALLGELVESDKDLPDEVEAHARQISQTARETTRVLDEIVWTVNPSNDTLEGLINYVCKYAQEYLEVAQVRFRIETPETLPAAPLLPEVRHNVFLAAKESVTNIVRHARATEARIRLRLAPGQFILEIEDNGRGLGGLDPKAARNRNGLRNMRKRMEDVGGAFDLEPIPEGGARVRLTAPLNEAGHA